MCKVLRFRSVGPNVGHGIILCNWRKPRQAREAQFRNIVLRREGEGGRARFRHRLLCVCAASTSGYLFFDSSSIDNEALILSVKKINVWLPARDEAFPKVVVSTRERGTTLFGGINSFLIRPPRAPKSSLQGVGFIAVQGSFDP
jgi:hypothetical protein